MDTRETMFIQPKVSEKVDKHQKYFQFNFEVYYNSTFLEINCYANIEYFSSKVECAGCCLANDYCIAFSWEILSGICHFIYAPHANTIYGKNADDREGPGRIEVYRDETFLQDVCFKEGFILI